MRYARVWAPVFILLHHVVGLNAHVNVVKYSICHIAKSITTNQEHINCGPELEFVSHGSEVNGTFPAWDAHRTQQIIKFKEVPSGFNFIVTRDLFPASWNNTNLLDFWVEAWQGDGVLGTVTFEHHATKLISMIPYGELRFGGEHLHVEFPGTLNLKAELLYLDRAKVTLHARHLIVTKLIWSPEPHKVVDLKDLGTEAGSLVVQLFLLDLVPAIKCDKHARQFFEKYKEDEQEMHLRMSNGTHYNLPKCDRADEQTWSDMTMDDFNKLVAFYELKPPKVISKPFVGKNAKKDSVDVTKTAGIATVLLIGGGLSVALISWLCRRYKASQEEEFEVSTCVIDATNGQNLRELPAEVVEEIAESESVETVAAKRPARVLPHPKPMWFTPTPIPEEKDVAADKY